jgi:hypothetical protein
MARLPSSRRADHLIGAFEGIDLENELIGYDVSVL